MHLTSFSLNLTNLPLLAPITISLFPSVLLTLINSSSSLRTIAIFPLFLILSNSLILVRFTIPFRVANIKYLVKSSSCFIFIIELMFSSFSSGNILIIGKPLDCLENSGIS